MNRREFLQRAPALAAAGLAGAHLLPTTLPAAGATAPNTSGSQRYNILFMLVDGQAPDLHSVLGGTTVRTPGLERLARRGTWFSNAYCEAPGCCPSRTALLTGVHAATSGIYYNNHRYRQATSAIAQATLLPQHFMRHGYLSAGFGFIAHGHTAVEDAASYSPGYARIFGRRDAITHNDADLLKRIQPGSLTKLWTGSWSWGVLPDDWDREDPTKLQQDTEQANRTIALLEQKHDRPFFATCGFWRPHVSWTVAQRYFDRFPLDAIELPPGYRADDLADVPKAARWLATHRGEHEYIVKNGLWKKCLQAYYASVAYADEQIDRVLRALEASAYRDNTIVVFTSDHGWHNGEKDHWSKFYLSERACGVPFAISVPGLPRQVCRAPVSLLDLYPTLTSLCGLPSPDTQAIEGTDLSAVLRGVSHDRGRPVRSTYGRGCHSLRDARFRYTRLINGAEELYDHERDPHEWHNLAADPEFAATRAALARWLPSADAPEVEYATGKPGRDGNGWDEAAFRL